MIRPSAPHFCLLLVLGFLGLVARPAAAGEAQSGGCHKSAECRRHSDAGHKLYSDRKYSEALTEFQRAYDIEADPRLLLNIGRALFHLGRPRAALRSYEQYQSQAQPDADTQRKLEKYIAEAKIAVEAERESEPGEAKAPDKPATPPPPPPPDLTTPPPAEQKPVYKKWWFWTAIGGAAVAVGLGVGLGVGLSRPKTEPFIDVVWR